jgi:hypothetical protein
MHGAYQFCHGLTTAVCGDKVKDLGYCYDSCRLLTEAVCGPNVNSLAWTYSNCWNLRTGVCGDNVVNMSRAYKNCFNLTSAVIGPKVNNTYEAFTFCNNLTNVVISNDATTLSDSTFFGCTSLTEINMPSNLKSLGQKVFANCTNLRKINFTACENVPAANVNTFVGIPSNCEAVIHPVLYATWINTSPWNTFAANNQINIVVSDEKIVELDTIKDEHILPFGHPFEVSFNVYNAGEDTPVLTVVENPTSSALVSITNVTCEKVNDFLHIASFKISALEVGEGATTVNVNLTIGSQNFSKSISLDVVAEAPLSFTVEPVSGASYGFQLNANGYYESKNKGMNNSAAVCKVNIVNPAGANVYFDCINYAESTFDFGILSVINGTLSTGSSEDTVNVHHSFKGKQYATVQTVAYGAVEGFVYVKFRKDSSAHNGNDTLQFKVRFEQ